MVAPDKMIFKELMYAYICYEHDLVDFINTTKGSYKDPFSDETYRTPPVPHSRYARRASLPRQAVDSAIC